MLSVGFITFLLMLNVIGEFVFGWPDHEFSVDTKQGSFMKINVDLVVAMPFISVDLLDATIGIHDGTKFEVGQAMALKEHMKMLSARQAVAKSRNSRGFFDAVLVDQRRAVLSAVQARARRGWVSRERPGRGQAADLHITTLGHGYSSHEHVDHKLMNLSHVITEFSFGPYFPDITQPLDNPLEVTHELIPPRRPHDLHRPALGPAAYESVQCRVEAAAAAAAADEDADTESYLTPYTSDVAHPVVTHYTRVLSQHSGTPGIFFKFDLDPMSLTIHQRTSTFLQLVIREGKGVMRTPPVVVSEARATRWQASVQQRAGRSGLGRWGARRGRGGAARIVRGLAAAALSQAPIPHSLVRSLHCLPFFTYPPLSCPLVRSLANPLLPVSRCVGVIGGVFVCMGYALKVTTAAVSALVDNSADEIPPAVASASALRTKFSGASLTKRARPSSGRLVPQGNGWVMESAPGSPVPYGGASSPYSGTPVSSTFPPPSPFSPASPYPGSPSGFPGSQPGTPGTGYGPPPMSARSSSGLGPGGHPRTPAGSVGNAAAMGIQPPGTPQYGIFPPTPGPAQTGFNVPPPPAGNKRLSMNGSPGAEKKKDD
ncbi:hypothetical protein K438DRAFT_1978762 [Mycena galopus ATCC 62051]|nr:hypothetical protein K438DRAFT_1978762 [Mycena galopus ATCC 62051]